MARIGHSIAEEFHFFDECYAETSLLSWKWHRHSEFEHIFSGYRMKYHSNSRYYETMQLLFVSKNQTIFRLILKIFSISTVHEIRCHILYDVQNTNRMRNTNSCDKYYIPHLYETFTNGKFWLLLFAIINTVLLLYNVVRRFFFKRIAIIF